MERPIQRRSWASRAPAISLLAQVGYHLPTNDQTEHKHERQVDRTRPDGA